jgi:hypothetical protein
MDRPLVSSATASGRQVIVITYHDGPEDPPHPGKAVKAYLLFRTSEDAKECARVLNEAKRATV